MCIRDRLPTLALSEMLLPAVAEMLPDVLPTLALIKMSLLAPVVFSVTVPVPSAVTALPRVSVPPVAVNEIEPFEPAATVLIAPLVVNAPVLVTLILPPPVLVIPVIVNGAAVLVN